MPPLLAMTIDIPKNLAVKEESYMLGGAYDLAGQLHFNQKDAFLKELDNLKQVCSGLWGK